MKKGSHDHLENSLVKNNLRKIREERLISMAELARRAGVSNKTIMRIEQGYSCRLDTKRKILKGLGLKLSARDEVFPELDTD